MPDYYFITSKLNGYVLDIKGASTAAKTPIISYPKKSSGTDNQLWERVPTGPKDSAGGQSQYYIKSKLNGNVLDIEGGNPNPKVAIISYPINSPASNNQIWQIVESSIEGYFYIASLLNDYVLDITGASTEPVTQIISYPKKSPPGDNQLWTFVEESLVSSSSAKKSAFGSSSPKKSAFA
jgi:hypothetical protein